MLSEQTVLDEALTNALIKSDIDHSNCNFFSFLQIIRLRFFVCVLFLINGLRDSSYSK